MNGNRVQYSFSLASNTGLCLHLASMLFLNFWTVNPDQEGLFYLTPVLWGSADAIWITLLGGRIEFGSTAINVVVPVY